jgi:hypothetical protein
MPQISSMFLGHSVPEAQMALSQTLHLWIDHAQSFAGSWPGQKDKKK